jgi:predicted metal-dependent RNase
MLHKSLYLVYKSKSYFTAVDIAAIFNLHFSNVGHKLGKAFGCVKKVVLPQPYNIVTKFDLYLRNLFMINYVILKGTRLLDLII